MDAAECLYDLLAVTLILHLGRELVMEDENERSSSSEGRVRKRLRVLGRNGIKDKLDWDSSFDWDFSCDLL